MFEITALSPLAIILLILAISGVTSWACTRVIREFLVSYLRHTPYDDKQPWWWNTVLRVLALLLGTLSGWVLMPPPLGPAVGFVGGALNTTIVAAARKRIKTFRATEREAAVTEIVMHRSSDATDHPDHPAGETEDGAEVANKVPE